MKSIIQAKFLLILICFYFLHCNDDHSVEGKKIKLIKKFIKAKLLKKGGVKIIIPLIWPVPLKKNRQRFPMMNHGMHGFMQGQGSGFNWWPQRDPAGAHKPFGQGFLGSQMQQLLQPTQTQQGLGMPLGAGQTQYSETSTPMIEYMRIYDYKMPNDF